MRLIEASAKSNQNIREIFTKLAQKIIDDKEVKDKEGGGQSKRDSVLVSRGQADKNSGCKC